MPRPSSACGGARAPPLMSALVRRETHERRFRGESAHRRRKVVDAIEHAESYPLRSPATAVEDPSTDASEWTAGRRRARHAKPHIARRAFRYRAVSDGVIPLTTKRSRMIQRRHHRSELVRSREGSGAGRWFAEPRDPRGGHADGEPGAQPCPEAIRVWPLRRRDAKLGPLLRQWRLSNMLHSGCRWWSPRPTQSARLVR